MAQRFEPTPSRAACSICDFRIVCPRGGRPRSRRRTVANALDPPLAQEPLEFARDESPEGTSSRVYGLVVLGRLLQALDERLDVGIGLHRQADLVFVVGGGLLQLGDVDRDADQHFDPAHQRQRRLRARGRRHVVGHARPDARRGQPGLRRSVCAARRRSRSGPRSVEAFMPRRSISAGSDASPSSPPAASAARRPAALRA